MGADNWLDEEVEILKAFYSSGGAELCKSKGLSKSVAKINNKANRLGIYYKKPSVSFSKSEIELIKKHYSSGGAKLCQEKGVNKGVNRINIKANRLGLEYNTN